MSEIEYKIELLKILNENSESIIIKLNKVLKIIPKNTQEIELQIFPDQDGEGTFSIQFSLLGKDLYVLNKSIKEYATIFDVIHTPSGLNPNVPLMDPFDTEFEVNDVLVDIVAEWIEKIWKSVNTNEIKLPIIIVADEGYGKKTPKKLQ